jgi:Zn-dependent protease
MNDREVLLILLAAIGLWGAWLVARLLAGVLQLCRMRFAPGNVEPAVRLRMPAEIAAILDPVGERLVTLGFVHAASYLVHPALRSGEPEPIWLDVYEHAATATRATLQLADTPEPGLLAAVAFETVEGGRHLRTENRRLHQHFPFPPAWEVADALAASLEEHWQGHCQRLSPGGLAEMPRPEVGALSGEFFAFWEDCAFMRRAGDVYYLTRGGAWRYLRQIMAGNRRVAQLPPPSQAEPLASRLFADQRAWELQERLLASIGMSRRGKLAWFAASAVAGLLAFVWMDSLRTALLIFAILLFHEFGHALAMRAFGYRNLGVLVLPFLGAVALGRKDDAGPWQKLVMLLAGPVPGLVLGALCLRFGMAWTGRHDWLNELGILFLSINLFNLLPFMPLDGGQIVETFLFARRPRLRLVFFAFSTLALVLLGYWLESVVLAGAGLLLALGIPAAWRRIVLLRGLAPTDNGEAAAGAILARLHGAPGARWPAFAQRMQMVRSLLPLLRSRAAAWPESVAGLALYLAALALPLLLLWGTPVPGRVAEWTLQRMAPTDDTPPDWDSQLADARTPAQRWQVLYDAGKWLEEAEQEEAAAQRFRAALVEAGNLPVDAANDLHRIDTHIALARLADGQQSGVSYRELLPVLRDLPVSQRWRLADVLEALSWQEFRRPERRQPYLQEAIAVREAVGDKTNIHSLLNDRIELARLLDAAGETAAAEKLLRQNLADEKNPNPWQSEPVAWFLIVHGQAAEAELILHRAERLADGRIMRQGILGWAYLAQGKQDQALAYFAGQLAQGDKHWRVDWAQLESLLDLVHASAGRADEEAKWLARAEAAKQHLAQEMSSFRRSVRREADGKSWESLRGQARLAVLLRLPGEEEAARADAAAANTCR